MVIVMIMFLMKVFNDKNIDNGEMEELVTITIVTVI